ncbi:N-acetylglucosamine-specific PTS transporter subunit IIBC [Phenylobacterium sp.]|jgi:PTS system N-acetylglucosamine-specific IIC component|uniref:N-acetylglucosamine-specific PTS transporter subunit IIBC n=1 Tax=Phenylobacterium sp. TaxID=1871053 RepID=UPI002E34D42E|nr:N-acetylglucosamine-specific PTS transporter subunit IIBC [Phenylobacterium sp.]HEX2560427.1 N-acetylglucosamine-specific PTS transporter subunit IIBC [Phenylobacterium sp.]
MKRPSFGGLQQLGRALMLPIAVLPIAALMLRIGQPDLLGAPALAGLAGGAVGVVAQAFAAAGGAVFGNLGLIFAVGVAVGLARENHGAAGLSGVVCFLVATEGAKALLQVPPEVIAGAAAGAADLTAAAWKQKEIAKLSIPAGILSGVVSGLLYNRYSDVRLPEYLAFFGGRRFPPIVCGLAGVGLALAFGYAWPALEGGMDALSAGVLGLGSVGLFLYGLLNRLLIITGLHHIINNLAWFLIGDYQGVTGDLNRFAAGDPTAGAFMTGFFPVMMFGLPAACLAMYHTARPERRKAVGGMLFSLALTSFLTGVTEPIEFSFMFLAPALYAVHAVLTGLSMALMDALGVRLGFGFSAGLFDYVLNFGKSTRPWLLLPIGIAYAAVYYAVFRFAIVAFKLKTPGREDEAAAAPVAAVSTARRGEAFAAALGGPANLVSVDACTTRLRLQIRDGTAVDEGALRGLGARGLVRPSADTLQVVLGPQADQVAGEIRASLAGSAIDARALAAALRGADLSAVTVCDRRLVVPLEPGEAIDEPALSAAGVRAVVRTSQGVQVLVGAEAQRLAAELRARAA